MKVKLTSTYHEGKRDPNNKDPKAAPVVTVHEPGKTLDVPDRIAKKMLDRNAAVPADPASEKYVKDQADAKLKALQPKSEQPERIDANGSTPVSPASSQPSGAQGSQDGKSGDKK